MIDTIIHDKLAKQIFGDENFVNDYRELLTAEFEGENNLPFETLKRLLETAAIFSATSKSNVNDQYKKLGYNIVVYLLNNYSDEYDGLMRIAQKLLIRLGNFPAVRMCIESRKAKDYYSVYSASDEVFNPLIASDVFAKQTDNAFLFKEKTDYFTNFQADVFRHLEKGKSISYSAPTSAGKSFILGHYVCKKFVDSDRLTVVYLVPTRALIHQVSLTFSGQFQNFGITDVAILTSHLPLLEKANKAKDKKLFVLTQERFKNLLFEGEGEQKVDVLIIDEAQKIGENTRGILLEEVVASALERTPSLQLIFLVPFAKKLEKFSQIFGLKEMVIEKTRLSPVSQNIFFVEFDGIDFSVHLAFPEKKEKILLLSVKGPYIIEKLEKIMLLETDSKKKRAIKKNLELEKKRWLSLQFQSESNIVYCNTPKECREMSKLLAERIDVESDDSDIIEASKFLAEYIHSEYYLIDYLKKGIAYHCGDMPQLVRLLVEDLFKDKKLKFICCTSTLLEGVNLPAKNIFLYKPKKGKVGIDRGSFWNLAGRAGRLLRDFYGNIYCLDVNEWTQYKPDVEDIEHEIESAFETALVEKHPEILAYLQDIYREAKSKGDTVEAVVTRFIIGELKRGNDEFIKALAVRNERLTPEKLDKIRQKVIAICSNIKVPAYVLERNSNIDPRKQNELYHRMQKEALPIPVHPAASEFYDNLRRLFSLLPTVFKGKEDKRSSYLCRLANLWIKERSLSEIIRNKIQFTKPENKDQINQRIDEVLRDLERNIRFEYLKYLKCYITIQSFVYDEKKWSKDAIAENLPNYLEFGAFKPSTLMFQMIGLSRSSAITISDKYQPVFEDVDDCRNWLNQNVGRIRKDLPRIAYKEIQGMVNKT